MNNPPAPIPRRERYAIYAAGLFSLGLVPMMTVAVPLMDRLGPRRMMIGCGLLNGVLLSLYPVMPWIGTLVALQLVVGFTQGLAWMGAQTRIALLARHQPHIVGRFTANVRPRCRFQWAGKSKHSTPRPDTRTRCCCS